MKNLLLEEATYPCCRPSRTRYMNVLLLLMARVNRSLSHHGTLIPHEFVTLGLYFGVKPSRAQPTEKVHAEERYHHYEVRELLGACIDCRWLRSAMPIPVIGLPAKHSI